jgi:alanine racemase
MPENAPQRPTYARIDMDNLAFNFHSVREFVGRDVRFMAVVKANAYGHGAVECARRLDREGADWFAVATLEEAIELRQSGLAKPILCLGGFYPGQEKAGLHFGVTPAVFTLDGAERIDRVAGVKGLKASVHIKVDTGMGRVGVPFADLNEFADRLRGLSNLEIQAVMTHFASADNLTENEFTNSQIEHLNAAVSIFRDKGFRPEIIDMANSPGAVAHPSSRADLVRIGGILYGLGRDVLPADSAKPPLKPVLSLHTRLAQVKRVPPGTSVGYGRTFITTRESVIGTIPIGYHDGYRRELSNRGRAIINGILVPVVGRVSMDWVTLDLTTVPDAAVGDEVTLIGRDGGHVILTEDLAADTGTISYEITCGISARVPRVYK